MVKSQRNLLLLLSDKQQVFLKRRYQTTVCHISSLVFVAIIISSLNYTVFVMLKLLVSIITTCQLSVQQSCWLWPFLAWSSSSPCSARCVCPHWASPSLPLLNSAYCGHPKATAGFTGSSPKIFC